MAREFRFRTLGEVVGGVRDNRQLGRVGIAIFPGVNSKLYAPIPENAAQEAGVELTTGAYFTAEVDLNAQTAEELRPSDLDVLLTKDGSILD